MLRAVDDGLWTGVRGPLGTRCGFVRYGTHLAYVRKRCGCCAHCCELARQTSREAAESWVEARDVLAECLLSILWMKMIP